MLCAKSTVSSGLLVACKVVVVGGGLLAVLGQVANVAKDPRKRLLRFGSSQLCSGGSRLRRLFHGVCHLVGSVIAHLCKRKQTHQGVAVLPLRLVLFFLLLSLSRFFDFGIEFEHFLFLLLHFSLASLILYFFFFLLDTGILKCESSLELSQANIVARVAASQGATTAGRRRREGSLVDALLSPNGRLSSPRFHGTHAHPNVGSGGRTGAVMGVLSSQPGARGNGTTPTSLGVFGSRVLF